MDSSINKKLKKALSKLVTKSDDKITVTSLCDKADVSRASFYLYHNDIDCFINKCREYILEKFFDQMDIIMQATDKELETVLLRKNIIFDDADMALLRYFAYGNSYFDFADEANRIIMPKLEALFNEQWGEDYCKKNKFKIKYFFNGFIMILYFALIDYNENKTKFEIYGSRVIAKTLFADAIGESTDGNWYITDKEIYKKPKNIQ